MFNRNGKCTHSNINLTDRPSRNCCLPAEDWELKQSRAIRVIGSNEEVSGAKLEKFFHKKIDFELVDRREWFVGQGKTMVEFSFPSVRGQSRVAVKCIKESIRGAAMEEEYEVCYAWDPCEPGNNSLELAFIIPTAAAILSINLTTPIVDRRPRTSLRATKKIK